MSIWTSRKFYAILLPILLVGVLHFFPAFHLDTEAAAGLVVIVVSYILGTAVDPGDNAGTWQGVVKSRKFWASLVGFVVMILDGFNVKLPAPFTPATLIELSVMLGAYIGGVAIEGVKKTQAQTVKTAAEAAVDAASQKVLNDQNLQMALINRLNAVVDNQK
jgi:hypothetical protein